MSKFTTEVRYICETYAGLDESTGFEDVETVINNSYRKVFNFDFPIFDEAYRSVLEKKILRHYYTREISEETVGLWKLRLCNKLNEIMPYYNQLYKSQLIEFNPLYDVDYTRDYNKKNEGNSTGNSSDSRSTSGRRDGGADDTSWNLYNDTPQGGLTDIEDMKYLTTATKDTNNRTYGEGTSGSSTGSNEYENNLNGVEDYLEHVKGINGGNLSKKIMEYRKSFLNIDRDVLNELKGLFFYLWE